MLQHRDDDDTRLVLTFLVLPFWYLLTRVVPDILQKSSKTVVCVCVCDIFIGCSHVHIKVRLILTQLRINLIDIQCHLK